MSRVIVLQAGLGGDAGWDADPALLRQLPYARRLELERRDPQSRHASLVALGLALEGLSRLRGCEVGVEELHFPQGGKPRCAGGESFSIAHTARRVAVAVSGDCEVGIDVEDRAATADHDNLVLGKLEHWTAVEAVLKAAGEGLKLAREVEIDRAAGRARLGGREYFVCSLELGPGVVAHLATTRPVGSVQVC